MTGIGEGQSLVDAMSARSSPGLSEMAMSNSRDVKAVRNELHCTCLSSLFSLSLSLSLSLSQSQSQSLIHSSISYRLSLKSYIIPILTMYLSSIQMKDELLSKLEVLGPHLPTNTLDELIDGLGGPDNVAEMTGRRGRVVSTPSGGVQYQLRSESDVSMEVLNIKEKQRFMDGEKVGVLEHVTVFGKIEV